MRSRDIFEALLRVAGVVFVFYGIADLIGGAARLLGLPMNPSYTFGEDVTAAVLWMLLGVVMLAATPRIARLFYGRDGSD